MPTQPKAIPKVSPMIGTSVDEYIAQKLTVEQAEIVNALRQLVRAAAPKSSEQIKWAQRRRAAVLCLSPRGFRPSRL